MWISHRKEIRKEIYPGCPLQLLYKSVLDERFITHVLNNKSLTACWLQSFVQKQQLGICSNPLAPTMHLWYKKPSKK